MPQVGTRGAYSVVSARFNHPGGAPVKRGDLTGAFCAANGTAALSFLAGYTPGVRLLAAAFVLWGLAACASTERADPHNPGDHCLYSCPDGMRCAGTVFRKGTSPRYGQCELEARRCLTDADCSGADACARFGSEIGLCRPRSGTISLARAGGRDLRP
jgi:hypothetical protein